MPTLIYQGKVHRNTAKIPLDAFSPDKWVDGLCDVWATIYVRLNGGRKVWLDHCKGHDELPMFIDHCVVKKNKKYIDALNPEGVDDWQDLIFVQRELNNWYDNPY